MGEQLEPAHFRIVGFSVDENTGSAGHFVRSVNDHQAALEQFFSRTNHDFSRFNYLGEWHSHPSFSVQPSREDILSMNSIVNDEKNIPFAVLLIVKLRFLIKLEYTSTVFFGNNLQKLHLYKE